MNVYVAISEAVGVKRTQTIAENVWVDYDKDGRVVGVEVLNAESFIAYTGKEATDASSRCAE